MLGLRDAMMAENLAAIAEREERRGPTLVFAHNRHLQRDLSTWQLADRALEWRSVEWWSAGALVDARLGDRYAFLACALGSAPGRGLADAAPDTLEGFLSGLPESRSLFRTDRLRDALAAP